MPDSPSAQEPTKTSLNAERVLTGAVALVDAIGMEAFTIRKLAAALDTKPMTIYYHVPNKESIIDGMVDIVFSEIDNPPTDLNWKTAIRQRSHSVRSVLKRHPWATPLMESRTAPGPNTLQHHNAVIGCFRNGGFSIEMTAHAYALIDNFIYGFALQEANMPATGGDEMAALAEEIIEPLGEDQFPWLTELATKHILQPDYDFGHEFAYGLDLILDGLETAASES